MPPVQQTQNMPALLKPLVLLTFVFTLAVVVLGAYTRLVDAGLGCPDWPTCYGHFWIPDSAEDIARANQNFADTPVESDKTWPEQLHRLFASSLGILIVLIFTLVVIKLPSMRMHLVLPVVILVAVVVARALFGDALDPLLWVLVIAYFANLWRLRHKLPETGLPVLHVAILLGLVNLQGLFGMWTVTLKLWPKVVTGHLLGGFTILLVLCLLLLRLSDIKVGSLTVSASKLALLRKILWLTAFALCVQIALGGWTSANYAALACADFPRCHNLWWPKADFVQGFNVLQQIGPNYLGGQLDNHARTAIHLTHRMGAVLLTLIVSFFSVLLYRAGLRRLALCLFAVLCVQLVLGISNIMFSLPLAVAVAHNAGGALLMLTLTVLGFYLYTVKPSDLPSLGNA